MAIFNTAQLAVDVKAQDRLRQWFSQRGMPDVVQITCVGLGDSDIDYAMSQQATRIKVIQAPYQVPKIKTHLFYSGVVAGITGHITTFLRHVNSTGGVESLYNFPPNSGLFTAGVVPPVLANGFDFSVINFDISDNNADGYIVYTQTLPDNYFDVNGVPERLDEQYTFVFNNVPVSWEVILDQPNNSFMIAKPAGYVFTSQQGSIVMLGSVSGIGKTVLFNY
jgi:hypothetical protein